jgi:drug/metabolite transporter (DMT)-like permease
MTERDGRIDGLALGAYATVCLVWGSTYLAIRVGVQHLPPALLGAFRFIAAGTVLLAVALLVSQRLPRRPADWRTNAIVGLLLLGVANGLVIWSEQFVHSGVAAIVVVTVSLWLAFFDAVIPGSAGRPTRVQLVGLLIGFAGTVLLVGGDLEELHRADWRGPLALTAAAAAWALGSIYSQRRPTSSGPYVNSALQMLAGGIGLIVAGTLRGEWATLRFSWAGFGAVTYLAIFGSIIGFTAYVYVLRHWTATVAGTYAYVNTVVAVFLGWLILDEPVTDRTIFAMTVVLAAVALVRRARRRSPRQGQAASRGPAATIAGKPAVPRKETVEA